MGDVLVEYDLPRPERANNRRLDGWRLCYIEDAHKEGNKLFLDVCESFRYGVMSYGSEQSTPREVEMQRIIQAIADSYSGMPRFAVDKR